MNTNNNFACIKLSDNTIVCKPAKKQVGGNNGGTWAVNVSALLKDYTSLGEERHLALLFLNIRRYTQLMETDTSVDVPYLVKILFQIFQESIRDAGGTIVETAADSLYAVFGKGEDIRDAMSLALESANTVIQNLKAFNQSYAKPYLGHDIEVCVGLHEGDVLVGHSDHKGQESIEVMGFPMNLMSRLESVTRELNNNLVMSEEAYQSLDNPKPRSTRMSVALKGTAKPVAVRLLGEPYIAQHAQRAKTVTTC
ncbi:adenylate/guanylate cyclase domain-containing protein [Cesiribacter sp. SM1]|uniref:adenylate/guanylate cyclase domain-containing protein n=1 Tax=Cesiribacter sp. SM1 TaxID=2861196 RepID=UPI001CD3885B|nr:adenylate/guanylate cyclase domain-containing protein [Cesiribacter sp. SM1]